jgi:hypothetical protein
MTIPYRPLTDEELEKQTEERITAALDALNEISDLVIPDELLSSLEATVEDFDWEQKVIEDDYDLYEEYCDVEMYRKKWDEY